MGGLVFPVQCLKREWNKDMFLQFMTVYKRAPSEVYKEEKYRLQKCYLVTLKSAEPKKRCSPVDNCIGLSQSPDCQQLAFAPLLPANTSTVSLCINQWGHEEESFMFLSSFLQPPAESPSLMNGNC